MSDVVFNEPVILRMPKTGLRKVATGFEALECLEREWPDWARGRRWRNAIVACRDALDGWRSAKEARRSFMKAAMRAGLVQEHDAREFGVLSVAIREFPPGFSERI